MQFKQRVLTSFFKKKKEEPNQSSDDSDEESEYVPSKKKQIFNTPMSWTRVRDVEATNVQRFKIYDVEEDLKADKSLKQIRKGAVRDLGQMLFDPDDFKDQADQLRVDAYKLTEEELRAYAELAASIRQRISQKASETGEEKKEPVGSSEEYGDSEHQQNRFYDR